MRFATKLLVSLIAVASLVGGGGVVAAAEDAMSSTRVPLPVITKGNADQCVEPTDVMRREHMEFILHQRDDTVHGGIRSSKHSLKECISCHIQRDEQGRSMPINAKDQFCQGCHEYAAVTIDCFECHATTPEGGDHNLHGLGLHSGSPSLTESMAMGEKFINQQAKKQ